jgi:predicted CopG family antitoxin
MDRKTVALNREAYELLSALKDKDESFSDVVKRLARKRRPLSDFIGIWGDVPRDDLKKIQEAMRRGRELDRERAAEHAKQWR